MTKSLLGGSAATAVALLSASLIFYANPSIAETLARVQSREAKVEQKSDSSNVKTAGEALSAEAATGQDANSKPPKSGAGAATTGKTSAPLNDTTDANAVLSFAATAYSLRGRTASGRPVARGVIAADRRVLPIGTRVRLDAGSYSGEYVVADTGGAVKGRKIDIWVPSTGEAMRFGRQTVKLTVLTHTRPRTTRKRR